MAVRMNKQAVNNHLNAFVANKQAKYGQTNGFGYVAGFFQSMLANAIVELPGKKQRELIDALIKNSIRSKI